MGNRFGNYRTKTEAESALSEGGFTQRPSGYWSKPSTDGFGFPMTALVEVTEGHVSGAYTESGKDEPYFQHHFL